MLERVAAVVRVQWVEEHWEVAGDDWVVDLNC